MRSQLARVSALAAHTAARAIQAAARRAWFATGGRGGAAGHAALDGGRVWDMEVPAGEEVPGGGTRKEPRAPEVADRHTGPKRRGARKKRRRWASAAGLSLGRDPWLCGPASRPGCLCRLFEDNDVKCVCARLAWRVSADGATWPVRGMGESGGGGKRTHANEAGIHVRSPARFG